MANKFLMLKGLQASGKSTYAKALVEEGGWVRVNRDNIRKFLKEQGIEWSHDVEKIYVIPERDKQIKDALKNGFNVVSDDTNLSPKNEHFFRGIAKEYGAIFETKSFLDVPLTTCIERDALREEKVGEEVIRKTAKQYGLLPNGAVAPISSLDPDLPLAIIVDLDGTLAIHHKRSPYEEEKCDTDLLNVPVSTVVKWARAQGIQPLFVSGRQEKVREKTQRWLMDWELFPMKGKMWMRPTNDKRDDRIVKKEIYEREIKGKYNILFVLDDRDRVVKMWREQGLTVFQVAEGNF